MDLAHDLNDSQRTKDVQISNDVTFDIMLLSSNTLEGLKKSGFIRPSPIQLHGIPLGKCGFDLVLEAKSGTGKTAVFTVIAFEKLDVNKGVQVIILAPTREIAAQICDVLRQIGSQYKGLCVEFVIGGLSVQDDIEKFKDKKVHIVVGSPGRLKHLISDQHIDVSGARLFVLDEADKLMEKSFLVDIKYIYSALPQQKQVILSSATYSESSKEFIKEFVRDAQHVCPNSDCILLGVVQKITCVKYNSNSVLQTRNRFRELLKIITQKQFKQCLIFCNYQVRVGDVHKMLTKEKWPAEQLYGSQDQIERLEALTTLQEYKCRLLIATDLAARGVDASNVDLVINFEPPFDWQTYLHRIGRAGRFGSYGMAITILTEGAEKQKFMNLLSTVNLSTKLTLLWKEDDSSKSDEEEIKISESLNHLQLINSKIDHDYTELWKIICNTENLTNKENIESFQELFSSFQHPKNMTNNIETFSDLFNSFQNTDLLDNKECQYKYIKCPKISAKQYLSGIKTKVNDILNQTNDSNDRVSKYVNGNDKCETESKKESRNNKYIEYAYTLTCDDSSRSNNKEYCMSTAEINNEVPLIEKNYTLNKEHQTNSYSCRRNTTKCDDRESLCSNSNKSIKIKKSTKSNQARNSVLNKSYKYNRSRLSTHNCNQNSLNDSSAPETINVTKHPTENTYIEWYNKLKLRVRQIELAIYIDELSKL